tara:strand:+ start:9116 stop:9502 length:387 start_codon:yes stop_codon:yes gene_type:complete
MDRDIPDELLPALRQYRGNDRDEFVFGFEQEKVINLFEDLKRNQLVWHDALVEQPDCGHFAGASICVLVVRDCGPDTLEHYSVSTYFKDGWLDRAGYNKLLHWYPDEVNGYRVTKWAYLGASEDIVTV